MTTPPMFCPSCEDELIATPSRHGLVWLCRSCRSGAATLPILRQVAPRAFVNHLWQAALHDGRVSSVLCPSCTQLFTTFRGSPVSVEPYLEVCTRCYWVWLGPASLSSLSQLGASPTAVQRAEKRGEAYVLPESEASPALARESLRWLAGGIIHSTLKNEDHS